MRALAVDRGFGAERVKVHARDRAYRVDQAHRIRPAALGRLGRLADIGDVRGQLHDAGQARILLHPARHHLDIFRHLPHGRTHPPLAHPVRAAEVQLDPVAFGLLDALQDRFPRLLHAGHHQRHDQRPVGIVALDRLDLAQVHLKRAVGDQLDIVDAKNPAVRAMHNAIARAAHVDDRRPVLAQGLPDDPAPTRLIGAADIVFLVRRRRRGQPERIGRPDPDEIRLKVCHLDPS